MNEKTLNTIEKQAENYCDEINNTYNGKKLICDFEITSDNEASFCVWDARYMENEDTYKEDIINIFKENGINPTVEWDYDSGDEYTRMCCLNITF